VNNNPSVDRPEATAMPVALTIAGSDCCAGAGIQADLKTFTAFGVYGLTAVTCAVAETPLEVAQVHEFEPDFVAEQVGLLLRRYPVAAVKTGMLGSAALVETVAKALEGHRARGGSFRLVVDPVMVATAGGQLLAPDAVTTLVERLIPLASIVTPNQYEAGVLLGQETGDTALAGDAALELAAKLGVPVVLKGGDAGGGERVTDWLAVDGECRSISGPRIQAVTTHGTGCTFAAGIAAQLALGAALDDAVRQAKNFVTAALAQTLSWPTMNGGDDQPIGALHPLPVEPEGLAVGDWE
jgi:hydroxymethylpyrimidine/phosphomethylpyrimidine kinase